MNPWTAREDALLGTDTDWAIAVSLGRTHRAVQTRRRNLNLPAYTRHSRAWTARELKLLGTMSDQALADQLGCRRLHVLQTRRRHGIAPYSPVNTPRKFRRRRRKS